MDQDNPDLDSAILAAIDSFRDEQNQMWTTDDDGRRALRIVERLAELVHSASEHLVPPDESWGPDWWTTVRELVDDEGFSAAVRERLQLSLAWKLAPRTGEMADRCIDVTRAIMVTRPGDRVLQYVRRLTSCYIAGFFPESVILSRAVVERALKDAYQRLGKPLPPTRKGESALGILIEDAHARRWLSSDARSAAQNIRLRGNKAVHEDPDMVTDVRATVHGAISVLRDLAAAQ